MGLVGADDARNGLGIGTVLLIFVCLRHRVEPMQAHRVAAHYASPVFGGIWAASAEAALGE